MKCYICMSNSYIPTYNACLSTHLLNCRDAPTSKKKKNYIHIYCFTATRAHTVHSTENSDVLQRRSTLCNEQLEALCLQTGQTSCRNSHWLRFVLQGLSEESSLVWPCSSELCEHSPAAQRSSSLRTGVGWNAALSSTALPSQVLRLK